MQSEVAELFARTSGADRPVAEFTVIVPTFNERDNVSEFVSRLEQCLRGKAWEVIFVDDDSTDGTAARVREIARQDPRVRCLQRIGRRGLSSACVEGMLASSSPYLAVIDGDCQHDETLLPRMLEVLKSGEADVVVGSRYAAGGGIGSWNASRAKMSRFATRLSRAVIKHDLSDPMSGFFALRREVLELAVRNLSSVGFKILLDIIASSPEPPRVKELPYEFRNRHAGESKLDGQAVWGYLMLLADKFTGGVVPVALHLFCLDWCGRSVRPFRSARCPLSYDVIIVHIQPGWRRGGSDDEQLHPEQRPHLQGYAPQGMAVGEGLVSFMLACSFGALANVGIASYLFKRHTFWALSALAGIVVGTVWNYAMTATYTWEKPSAKIQQ